MKILRLHLLIIISCLTYTQSIGQINQYLSDAFNDTYFYKINATQASDLINSPLKVLDSSMFRTLAYIQPSISDSLPLIQGNYLKIDLQNNKLAYEYLPITSWRTYILQHHKNLTVQLLDLKTGNPVKATSVMCGKHEMIFDIKTQSYILKNTKPNTILSITDKNETFYFSITKTQLYYSPTYSRSINSFLNKRPLNYVAGLYRLYNRFLMDGIIELKHKYNYQSTFKETSRNTTAIWRSLNRHSATKSYPSYFYFNKPKYKEHDTIKFKAHILKDYKNGAWYNKPVLVFLDEDGKDIYLGQANSKRKGAGYDFQFVIQDSMDIYLDDDYEITLKDLDSNKLGAGRFTYEDYELKKAIFEISLQDGKTHYKGKPFGIHFIAKDENGLAIPDTKAQISLLVNKVNNVAQDRLFIPDTLWTYTTNVKNGEDTLIIPDSIFPLATIEYSLNVVMSNSEKERTELNEYVEYQLEENEIKMNLENNNIHITQTNNQHKKLHVYAEDIFGLIIVDTMVNTPSMIPINTNAEIYHCESDDDNEKLNCADFDSEINSFANRGKDSISFLLENPRKVSIVYFLYESGKEIKRGTNSDFPFNIAAKDKKRYALQIKYVWAGQTKNENTIIPLYKNTIKFNIEKPGIITPGKEVDIKITATDYKDKPIKDLNILAYSFTQKFEAADFPSLPYGNFIRKNEDNNSDYQFKDNDIERTPLNYRFWNEKLSLDTNWTYRFRYPSRYKIEHTLINVKDSITQIAPFIMDDGAPQAIQYVYIDNVPVYLGFTDKKAAYSFEVTPTYHQIVVRTSKKLLTIDSFKAKRYVKTLFSIDQNDANVAVRVESMPDSFTLEERYKLALGVMIVDMPKTNLNHAYLERAQDLGQYIDISQNRRIADGRNHTEFTVGPIYWRYWKFNIYNSIVRSFEYEPEYTYTFDTNLVKMRANKLSDLVPRRFTNDVPNVNETVLTKAALLERYDNDIFDERRNRLPEKQQQTLKGSCNLTIDYEKTINNLPVNIIIGRPNDFNFLYIYPGKTTEFNNLEPGNYQLLLIDKYNSYRQTGIIEIRENGTNFYRITKTDTVKEQEFNKINEALIKLYQPVDKSNKEKKSDLSLLMNAFVNTTYNGPIQRFSGIIIDDQNEPIIAASLKIAGTQIGTITDIDGAFNIDIPLSESRTLIVSALGYETDTFYASRNMKLKMKENNNSIDEVSIYGAAIDKRSYTGSISTISAADIAKMPVTNIAQALEGSAAGVNITSGGGEPGAFADIKIRGNGSISTSTYPLVVIDGAVYNGGLTTLDPSFIASMIILKDASSTSIYGSRGANGVIVITTKKGAILPEQIRLGLQKIESPTINDMMVSGLRSNFRDDAYWQPDLVTDINGEAAFRIKFPDDITNWRTMLFATDNKKHTGFVFGNIKSYKPIAASLYTPRFLLDDDTAMLIGKTVNYIPDSIPVTTTFFQNDSLREEHKLRLGNYRNDTLWITDKGVDSIKLKYLVTKEDGYFDGEQKSIPLHRVGVKIAKGNFVSLDMKDTSFSIYPANKFDTLHLSATASLVDVVLNEIDIVRDYGYLCNEQMASKILAMLAKQKMYVLLQKDFSQKDKDYINELLRKITKNQNSKHLWGWWESGISIDWISHHVLHAITESKALGYTCNIDLKPIMNIYIFELEKDTVSANIPMLQTLFQNGVTLNYEKYISRLEHKKSLSINDYFELTLLRQQMHLPYTLDRLNNLKEEDIFGNVHWKDTAQDVYCNEILTTVNALRIIENDTNNIINKRKVINWLLQQRNSIGWRNTYESTKIIEAIAPYIPIGDSAVVKPELQINGSIDEKVTTFPYKKAINIGSALNIHKTGATPIYFTWHYNYWDTTNTNLGKDFLVTSYFVQNEKEITNLSAGEPVTMIVHVDVLKSAEYVMIEIPIPAGCSYESKDQSWTNNEIHREYFEDKVSIFCEKLPKGSYTFKVALLPRYRGKYTINPAKAELMYFPVFYGREKIKKVEIVNGK